MHGQVEEHFDLFHVLQIADVPSLDDQGNMVETVYNTDCFVTHLIEGLRIILI